MPAVQEQIVDAIKATAWLNEPRELLIDDSMRIRFTPHAALAALTLLHDEHYPCRAVAQKSCDDVAATLNRPLRLWETSRGRFFFVHALFDCAPLGCKEAL